MKCILIAVTLMSICALAALAQNVSTMEPMPPPICKPCLFYGGDITPSDPNADAFPDGNTLIIGGSETLGAVKIPSGHQAVVEGLLFNALATADDFNPKTATWEIRIGVSDGNGGTQIASGSGGINVAATGRSLFGYNEYTVAVAVNPPVTLPADTYWFNVSPQCTNTGDGNCSTERFYASNTTHGTNNVRGWLQPLHQMYFEDPFIAYPYANLCDPSLGFNSYQCAALSFGVIGTGH
jgi:hypothetical protein